MRLTTASDMGVQEHSSAEITRLHRCLNDLVSVLALPAMWSGSPPSQIVHTLLDALLTMLNLDLVYARFEDPAGGPPIEVLKIAPSASWIVPDKVHKTVNQWFGDDPKKWPSRLNTSIGGEDVSIVCHRCGLYAEIGVIVAGSGRADFPGQTESLLLSVAANEAVIGLHEARLLLEQKRVAGELDRRVAQRTAELAAVNDELRREIAERHRAEEALLENELNSRLILHSIPGLVCTMSPSGEVDRFNPQILEYFGKEPAELKGWATNDAVHPDDLSRVVAAFTHSITTGTPYDIEHRCRRADGVYRWFQARALPVRDTAGRITGWYVLLTDIDDRKRAEDAIRASERNLYQTINTIPALAWSARPDGSADFFNQHYLDYVGLSAEQVKDCGWMAAIHPDDLNDVMAVLRRMIAEDQPAECEGRLRRFDGKYRWFLFRTNPLRDESGKTFKWYGIKTDIDDRKRAEEELRRSEAFLAEGQRLTLSGSFLWRLDTDEITFSEQLYRIHEFDRDSPVTLDRIRSRIHPEDLPLLAEKIHGARTGGNHALNYEIRLRMPNGSVKYLRTIAHGARDRDGRLEIIGAVQDVTERRLAEEALTQARSDLAHVTRVTSLGMLTASIAHEVNQPLSGIITNASTCLRMLAATPPNVEGARETAKRTIRDGNRASELVTRLRALFGKKESATEPVDLNEAAQEVIALSLSELQRNRVILRAEFADDLPVVIGDRVQLQQVILNLLKNASDAMRPVNDRPRQLRIRTERSKDDQVRLTVQDAGVGLDRQAMDRLFQAFYTTKNDGMGIGLSVSRSIIERHHGRLWAEPNDGPGTTFSFSIPPRQGGTSNAGLRTQNHSALTGVRGR
jgi:PAS domain S-box-containing protein